MMRSRLIGRLAEKYRTVLRRGTRESHWRVWKAKVFALRFWPALKVARVCYLCGEALGEEISRDQCLQNSFLRPEEIRRGGHLSSYAPRPFRSVTRVHQHDEDISVYSLCHWAGFLLPGDALRRKVLNDCKRPDQHRLLGVVMREFVAAAWPVFCCRLAA